MQKFNYFDGFSKLNDLLIENNILTGWTISSKNVIVRISLTISFQKKE